ncbi:hypothetical protein CEXT_737461 [Caerostris extrusa]|uniref:Uncharacterized protein n=1 Tax=Caerostris extrusa TaxID=172846 RepID=A0AAV4XV41_CAEEX|nr:hypothetical protein CEXT_737461 [Caerostris extrusa]
MFPIEANSPCLSRTNGDGVPFKLPIPSAYLFETRRLWGVIFELETPLGKELSGKIFDYNNPYRDPQFEMDIQSFGRLEGTFD